MVAMVREGTPSADGAVSLAHRDLAPLQAGAVLGPEKPSTQPRAIIDGDGDQASRRPRGQP